ncbi:MAG: DUF349 domain-containing protein [Candidatus Symbiothrix sp.]|jgi:hypothetical protein|nr:DUF349 domain-containing protein [Candidatus Symbiothrix sp.]
MAQETEEKLLETAETTAESIETEAVETEIVETEILDKQSIIERLELLVEQDVSDTVKNEVDALKQSFYKLKRTEIDAAKKDFADAGGLEEDFQAPDDDLEEKLKELLGAFRDKRSVQTAEQDKIKEDNLAIKKGIIEQLKDLIESQDNFSDVYNKFKQLQQQWKEITDIPQAAATDLWKDYQLYCERFYDLARIYKELRDYDFKKNLELKQNLCEAAERLDSEKDIISAFYQLQKLHQEWRETGPVERALREEIWARFKAASSVINKKHQNYFDHLREKEQQNLIEKTALCEAIEAIDFKSFTMLKQWMDASKQIVELQSKWKSIGFAPKKQNIKIFDRFRSACDAFFQAKSAYFKTTRDSLESNLAKKRALCEQAEALKDSQEWKETAEKFVALQKEWKTVGITPNKHSETLWKRFIAACDYFFEQKNAHFSSAKSEEKDNLKKKKDIVAQIVALDESLPPKEALVQIREYIAQYQSIGFVPFREKEKITTAFHQALNKHFDRLKIDESERRLESFRSNMKDLLTQSGDKSKNKLYDERAKLMRTYDRIKTDLQTYENNIGFLSVSSKGGNSLLKDMEHRINSLKEELKLIEKKIEVIDQNVNEEN